MPYIASNRFVLPASFFPNKTVNGPRSNSKDDTERWRFTKILSRRTKETYREDSRVRADLVEPVRTRGHAPEFEISRLRSCIVSPLVVFNTGAVGTMPASLWCDQHHRSVGVHTFRVVIRGM